MNPVFFAGHDNLNKEVSIPKVIDLLCKWGDIRGI